MTDEKRWRYRQVAESRLNGASQADGLENAGFSRSSLDVYDHPVYKQQLLVAQCAREGEFERYRADVFGTGLSIAQDPGLSPTARVKALELLGRWTGMDSPRQTTAPAAGIKKLQELVTEAANTLPVAAEVVS